MLGANKFVTPTMPEWGFLVGTAVTMQLAQHCMTTLLQQRPVASSAPSSFLIICWNVLFGCLLGDPLPGPRVAVGCLLILVPLAVVESRNAAAPAAPVPARSETEKAE